MNNSKALFDSTAQEYDTIFSHTWLGRYFRQRTQQVFKKYWNNKAHILELNAGTGEDAIYLAGLGHKVLATEISESMLSVINQKIDTNNYSQEIRSQKLDIKNLDELSEQKFDGILSNFGGLNCINDWSKFSQDAHSLLKPQGILVVCLMGPLVPWEWLWFLARGKLSQAFRRVNGECEWRGAKIYYPESNKFENFILSQPFQLVHREAIGVLMPPSYVSQHVERWKKSYSFIARIEELICRTKIACRVSDHYLLVFKKLTSG